ncbi:thioesterase-like superfamily-domain-containing protein [Tricharina praecox]|uniref:thioesterase-like superfamily-domain-containing protein n=1 Tax=Tricharina praecox TaxID=43433 RepID=UPI00221E425B|nr:thioesterase-like superfamily-domain-containing protein [Tricharina praecox]KAI5857022.1 thioesterase-like superfamily-domain-containing protein [Tricharina praecox]
MAMKMRLRLPCIRTLLAPQQRRHNSAYNARWLSDQKTRLGRLFFHGCTAAEVDEAGQILQDMTREWRRYIAGAEGYLISAERRGLYRLPVAWGDMRSESADEADEGRVRHVCHVNNVTYNRWAESARINWAWNLAKHVDPANNTRWSDLWTPRGLGLILRSINVDYKFPMEYPDKVTVYHKLGKIKDDSFGLDVIILSEKHQRVAARCLEDIVVYNYKPSDPTKKPGKAPIPGWMRDVFEETMQQQKEAAKAATNEMRKIGKRIDSVESRVLVRKEM